MLKIKSDTDNPQRLHWEREKAERQRPHSIEKLWWRRGSPTAKFQSGTHGSYVPSSFSWQYCVRPRLELLSSSLELDRLWNQSRTCSFQRCNFFSKAPWPPHSSFDQGPQLTPMFKLSRSELGRIALDTRRRLLCTYQGCGTQSTRMAKVVRAFQLQAHHHGRHGLLSLQQPLLHPVSQSHYCVCRERHRRDVLFSFKWRMFTWCRFVLTLILVLFVLRESPHTSEHLHPPRACTYMHKHTTMCIHIHCTVYAIVIQKKKWMFSRHRKKKLSNVPFGCKFGRYMYMSCALHPSIKLHDVVYTGLHSATVGPIVTASRGVLCCHYCMQGSQGRQPCLPDSRPDVQYLGVFRTSVNSTSPRHCDAQIRNY